MKRAVSILVAAVSATLPQSASSQSSDAEDISVLSGECLRLVYGRQNFSEFCEPKLVNATFASGRSTWTFTLPNAVMTFSGWGNQQVLINADTAEHPIDRVLLNLGIEGVEPAITTAVGSCRFGNPNVPVRITCSATTSEGDVVGLFLTDGSAPETLSR
ncbi:hypothetical protein [Brevundimonas sp.]|uniref:hypothetical protein n=1 Tax=Brevundimonas sp. TaxID=1871086 RepID=UPI0028A85D13|nr:hypothetical protein [Brevundimonas sp.]